MSTQDHWTDNEDLLALYILERVMEPQRSVLRDHLDSCAQCQARVEAEIILAAGVRRNARAELKKRLSERLGSAAGPRSGNWKYALSAAAVVVLAVGIGVLSRWYSHEETIADNRQTILEKSEPAEKRELRQERADKAEPTPARTEQPAAQQDKLLEEGTKRDNRIANAPTSDLTGAAGAGGASDFAAQRKQKVESASKELGIAGGATRWVEGDLQLLPSPSAAPSAVSEAAKDASAELRAVSKGAIAQRQAAAGDIRVSQRLTADLPLSQQRVQQRRAIPTELKQSGDTLRMTLFFDRLVPEVEWNQAAVEQLGDDSLVVRLPGRVISYKLPTSAMQQGRILQERRR